MKSKIKLKFSCSESFSKMPCSDKGRFCKNCDKTVYNLTTISDNDIVRFLTSQKASPTCGYISYQQINRINGNANSMFSSIKKYLAGILIFITSCNPTKRYHDKNCLHEESFYEISNAAKFCTYKDSYCVSGKVIDNEGHAVIGATIHTEDMVCRTDTDYDGQFHLEIPKEYSDTTNLTTRYIGYYPVDFKLKDIQGKKLDIHLTPYPGCFLGEVVIEEPFHKRIWKKLTRRKR